MADSGDDAEVVPLELSPQPVLLRDIREIESRADVDKLHPDDGPISGEIDDAPMAQVAGEGNRPFSQSHVECVGLLVVLHTHASLLMRDTRSPREADERFGPSRP